ncbi:hypothetical protein [Demequina mangrovi]|uniref:Alpha-N-arabinofuranosidase n=1 Tax=Demequina mangrovi TaxID=1043493 RepID=A0A1H6W1W6_9MICO|nr:hypothetical protein [Demequina mangrovi]SEJ10971.1 alpha-N-arabinofuranosidase [Demequina mangrovi]
MTELRLGLERPGAPVRAELFSQFFEHMSYATIGGLSAELVVNPTFVQQHHLQRWQIDELLANGAWTEAVWRGEEPAGRWMSAPIASGVSTQLFHDEAAHGVPLAWSAIGTVAPCVGRVGDGVRIRAGGLRQVIFVPTHRTSRLEIAVWARTVNDAGPLRLELRRRWSSKAGVAGELLAEAAVEIMDDRWAEHVATLDIAAAVAPTEPVELALLFDGDGLTLDRISVLPSDHADGLDPEVVAIAQGARIPELRWPGGNAVSYYHWRDGVGPQSLRPSRPNYAWGGIETHHIGTDEYVAFCRTIGARPHITVNMGTGTAEEAAAWVEYCNGSAETPMGRLRAAHGHPEPYGVDRWEIGNETYGSWQGGFVGPEENGRRFALFAEAMRAASPIPLMLHAAGNWFDLAPPRDGLVDVSNDGRWHGELLRQGVEHLDVVSIHGIPINDRFFEGVEPDAIHQALMAWCETALESQLPELLAELDAGTPPGREAIRLSVTEWGPIGASPGAASIENVDGAVWAVAFLGGLTGFGDRIEMASPNGFLHGGAIKKGGGVVYPDPVFSMVARMRALAGARPLPVEASGPTFRIDAPADLGRVEESVPYLRATALLMPSGDVSLLVASYRAQGEDVVEVPGGFTVRSAELFASAPGLRATPAVTEPARWEVLAVEEGAPLRFTLPARAAAWLELAVEG